MTLATGGNSFALISPDIEEEEIYLPPINVGKKGITMRITLMLVVLVISLFLAISGAFRDKLNIHTSDVLQPNTDFNAANGFTVVSLSSWFILWCFLTILVVFGMTFGASAIAFLNTKWVKTRNIAFSVVLLSMLAVGLFTPAAVSDPENKSSEWAAARYGVSIKEGAFLDKTDIIRNLETKDPITIKKIEDEYYLYDSQGLKELPILNQISKQIK